MSQSPIEGFGGMGVGHANYTRVTDIRKAEERVECSGECRILFHRDDLPPVRRGPAPATMRPGRHRPSKHLKLIGEGVELHNAGYSWYYIGKKLGVPVTSIRKACMARINRLKEGGDGEGG